MATWASFSGRGIGAFILTGGLVMLGLNLTDEKRDFSASDMTATKIGRLDFYPVGRGEAIVLRDDHGKVVASCLLQNCGYKNDRSDAGKAAEFLVTGGAVFEIRVDGTPRITRDQIERRFESRDITFGVVAFTGLAVLVGSLFL